MIPFLGIVLTGALAVYFYRRDKGTSSCRPLSDGASGGARELSPSPSTRCVGYTDRVFHAQQEYIEP